jgi:hypothetical protein
MFIRAFQKNGRLSPLERCKHGAMAGAAMADTWRGRQVGGERLEAIVPTRPKIKYQANVGQFFRLLISAMHESKRMVGSRPE